ncbi:MAG: SNF2 family DNA or RNA helicase [Oleiphilaceae bacterium]|jgi:SNF2 family DNA or RNA helicase
MGINVVHGFWSPERKTGFIQSGNFQVWVETDQTVSSKSKTRHGYHYKGQQLADFLKNQLAMSRATPGEALTDFIKQQSVNLPTQNQQVLPSPEFWQLSGIDTEESDVDISLQPWKIESYCLAHPIGEISQLHFLSLYELEEVTLGQDFLFWYYFSQSLREVILKDQYIPGLIQVSAGKGRTVKAKKVQIFRQWQIVSTTYEQLIQQARQQMPLACSQGYEPESLLRHFSEVMIDELLNHAIMSFPTTFNKKLDDSLLDHFVDSKASKKPILIDDALFSQWHRWQKKITNSGQSNSFDMGFQLIDAPEGEPGKWRIDFLAISAEDPSFKLLLRDYWLKSPADKKVVTPLLGKDFEQKLILLLGQAAQIYPLLWQGMESETPESLFFDMNAAFDFLKESAWVLEDAGFKVIIPSWWTPKGRQRAKMRLRTTKRSTGGGANPTSQSLSLGELVDYHYELAIGEHSVSIAEWQALVNSKASLVNFRGQWMELDQAKMAKMLDFWQQQKDQEQQLSFPDIMQKLATEDDLFEVDPEDGLAQMLSKLKNGSQLQPVENPSKLNGQLRAYQKTGVAWLRYLEHLGLNGCLADDMGLGKTIQVICSILVDQESNTTQSKAMPTLLVAPTSVIGNWQKEVEKFANHLRVHVHHGSERDQDEKSFVTSVMSHDIVITSYSLVRRDSKLFASVHWKRVVLDEAQNIKNPKAAQTKAVYKLQSQHRLALTGTPVENRLMDLWSIFNFLNPGYLGKQAQFRKRYELPIQRDKDPKQTKVMQQLLKPFILRRLKTDKTIIQDLPDKVENRLYCNLTAEQASLYEAVVKDVSEQLEDEDGIARQGLILSTLMKLKQICNHPAQFLQDESAFIETRSHKLQRLSEMLEEAMADGDSVLIFTQFTEIGDKLQAFLRDKKIPTYYIHGGVSRNKREKMIDKFQSAASGPAVFILSIKAGGAGITLTKANHVFHFDRWWNPAVEDQATDRAFRIGQKKNVFVHKFVTLGTLEEKIDQMIEDKKKISNLITSSDESWVAKLDNQAFKQLITLNRQSVME